MAQATTLSDRDVQRVLKVITLRKHAARDRVAFMLSLYAGMRVGEIAALKVGDVAGADGSVVTEIRLKKTQTKGNKARIVWLSERVRKELRAYLQVLPRTNPDFPLIYSQKGRTAFSSTTLCMLFRQIYREAGLKTSSHAGRRTFATRLNAKGVGMATIQKLMGHSSISTTALYCQVSDDTLRQATNLL